MTGFTNSASILYSRPEAPPFVATVALFGALVAGTGGFYSPLNAARVTEWTSFPAIAIYDTASGVRKKTFQADSIPRAITQIRDKLGLKMSELAEIFGVSRQAVYLWLKGENLKSEYIQRVWQLNVFAERVRLASIDRPEHFIHRPLSPAGESLFQLLVNGGDPDSALALLKEQAQAEQRSRAESFAQHQAAPARKRDYQLAMELATPILDEFDE